MSISDADRTREEDPGTATFGRAAPNQVAVARSRFEVDLNRPQERAVYRDAEDAWGLTVWRAPLSQRAIESSRALYDAFYAEMTRLLDDLVARYGGFIVLDLHSYNHRRGGPLAAPDDSAANPDVNIGTGSADRRRWSLVIDGFIADLSIALGTRADVRENVKFRGGHFARWVHESYPSGLCIAVEFKKTYMDEWSGDVDPAAVEAIAAAIASTLPGLERALATVLAR